MVRLEGDPLRFLGSGYPPRQMVTARQGPAGSDVMKVWLLSLEVDLYVQSCVQSSINSYEIGDSHQPNSGGLYTNYKDSLLNVGSPSPI